MESRKLRDSLNVTALENIAAEREMNMNVNVYPIMHTFVLLIHFKQKSFAIFKIRKHNLFSF